MGDKNKIKNSVKLFLADLTHINDSEYGYFINSTTFDKVIDTFGSRSSLIDNIIYFNEIYSLYGIAATAAITVHGNTISYFISYRGKEIFIKHGDMFYKQSSY